MTAEAKKEVVKPVSAKAIVKPVVVTAVAMKPEVKAAPKPAPSLTVDEQISQVYDEIH